MLKRILRRLARLSASPTETFSARRGPADGPRPDAADLTLSIREVGPVYVIIRSWNRPVYLWACLDSLYRGTRYPCRFIFLDNASTDPLVQSIARGFELRGLFHAMHFMEHNQASNQREIFARYRSDMGRYVVLLDADVTIQATSPDWLERLITVAERHPDLAIVGSVVDTSDFIDPDWAQRVAPNIPRETIDDLIKAKSPERRLLNSNAELIDPFRPPGRLLLLRTSVADQVGLLTGNRLLVDAARAAGHRVGMAAQVRHRHLSLLNFFDYPEYDFDQLDRYLQDR